MVSDEVSVEVAPDDVVDPPKPPPPITPVNGPLAVVD